MSTFRFHSWTVVEVETDDGIVGLGNVALAPHVAKVIIDQYLAPLVIGGPVGLRIPEPADVPRDPRMGPQGHRHGRDLGGRHRDLGHPRQERRQARVQAARRPHQEKIPCYYSKLYRTDLKEMQDEAQRYLKEGFRAFKMRFGYRRARAAGRDREPEVGRGDPRGDRLRQRPDARVLHGLEPRIRETHPAQAREIPAALAGEPVIADDIDGYAELNQLTRIPISGGEHEFSLYGFKQLLDRKAVSVVQYDTNRVGGITMAHKINALCEAYSVPVIPHAGQMHNYHLTMSTLASPMSSTSRCSTSRSATSCSITSSTASRWPRTASCNCATTSPGLGLTLKTEFLDQFDIVE